MPFSTTGKNEMLDGLTVDLMSLHTGDPGAAGTANEVTGSGSSGAYARVACSFSAASSSARALASAVNFVGPNSGSAKYIGLWENAGTVFKGSIQITSGDTSFNASGQFQVTTAASLTLSDS